METKVIIRKAELQDIESVFQLANQLSEFVKIDRDIFLLNYPGFIKDKNHCILVAEYEGSIIGYLSGYFRKTIYANGMIAYIDEIVVLNTNRNLKIGTLMMTELERIAQTHNCVLISLATAGAKGFYEKLGYSSKAGYYKKYL